MKINAQDLKTHQWKHRIVVIYTTDASNETFQNQLKTFENAANEMLDRKLVVYKVIDDRFELTYYDKQHQQTGKVGESLQKVIHEKEAFEVLLIGLDGGVKLRQTAILTKEKLFNTIDSMPMRQREMRREKN